MTSPEAEAAGTDGPTGGAAGGGGRRRPERRPLPRGGPGGARGPGLPDPVGARRRRRARSPTPRRGSGPRCRARSSAASAGAPGSAGPRTRRSRRSRARQFFLVCHDDVVFDPTAVRVMVEEAFRSNAAIVGPKLVDADDPSVLLEVGRTIDRFGGPAHRHRAGRGRPGAARRGARRLLRVERGDAHPLRPVRRARRLRPRHLPGRGGPGPLLARAPRRRTRAGRAGRAGPPPRGCGGAVDVRRATRARPRPQPGARPCSPATRRGRCCGSSPSGWPSRSSRRSRSRRPVVARTGTHVSARGGGTCSTSGACVQRASAREALRRVHDSELHELQVGAGTNVGSFLTQQHADSRMEIFSERTRDALEALGESLRHPASIALAAFLVFVLLGSRDLFSQGVPAVGDLVPWTGVRSLATELSSAWRHTGLGSTSAAPPALAMMAGLGTVLLGGIGLAQTLVVVGAFVVGSATAFRLARGIGGSLGAASVTAVVYGVAAVPRNAVANGRLGPLVLYALAPAIALLVVRAGAFSGGVGVSRRPHARARHRDRGGDRVVPAGRAGRRRHRRQLPARGTTRRRGQRRSPRSRRGDRRGAGCGGAARPLDRDARRRRRRPRCARRGVPPPARPARCPPLRDRAQRRRCRRLGAARRGRGRARHLRRSATRVGDPRLGARARRLRRRVPPRAARA